MSVLVALDAGTGGGKASSSTCRADCSATHAKPWSVRGARQSGLCRRSREFGFDPQRSGTFCAAAARAALARRHARRAGRRRHHHQPARRLRVPRRRRPRDLRRTEPRQPRLHRRHRGSQHPRCRAALRDHRTLGTVHLPARALPVVSQARQRARGAPPDDQRLDDLPSVRGAQRRAVERHRVDAVRLAPARAGRGDPRSASRFPAVLPPVYSPGEQSAPCQAAAAASDRARGRHAGVRRRRGHAVLAVRRRGGRARRHRRHPRNDHPGADGRRRADLRSRARTCGPAATSCRTAG